MLRFARSLVLRVVAVALCIGAVALGIMYVRFLASADPFASIRSVKPERNDSFVIDLRDTKIIAYEGNRMALRARVGLIQVSKDRKLMRCSEGVHGAYHTAQGESFNFRAERGDWNGFTQVFDGTGGAKISNKDIDLETAAFHYDSAKSLLTTVVPVSGRLGEGNLNAKTLEFRPSTRDYFVTDALWKGSIDSPLQEGKKSRWTVKAKSIKKSMSDLEQWVDAEATDGEIIVKAPLIERNTQTDTIVATPKVQYFSAKENITCDKATIIRPQKYAILEGNVQVYVKPEGEQKLEVTELTPFRPEVPEKIAKERPQAPPKTDQEKKLDDEVRSAKNKRKYPVLIWADKVEYWYARGGRRAIITGSPHASQDLPGGRWRKVWTYRALYDGERETLKLESREGQREVRVLTSLGDDLLAKWYLVSTKENDDQWEAEDITGTVAVEDEDVPNNNNGGGTGNTTGSSSTGGTTGGLSGPIGGGKRKR